MKPTLMTIWEDGPQNGIMRLTLSGVSMQQLEGAALWFTSQLFPRSGSKTNGADLQISDGSCHVLDNLRGLEVTIGDLDFVPRHAGVSHERRPIILT